MRNVEAYLGANGRARWDYLVFKHNQHQVDEARKLSEDMGFEKITIKSTARFMRLHQQTVWDRMPLMNVKGEPDGFLEKTTLPEFQNEAAMVTAKDIIDEFGSLESYFEVANIKCKVARLGKNQDKQRIYVSSEGLVFPCCFTASEATYTSHIETPLRKILLDSGGHDIVNAKKRPIRDIINGDIFRHITDSWEKRSFKDGRIMKCAWICSERYDPIGKEKL